MAIRGDYKVVELDKRLSCQTDDHWTPEIIL